MRLVYPIDFRTFRIYFVLPGSDATQATLPSSMVANIPTKQPRPPQKPLRPPGTKLGDFLWHIEMWIWTALPCSVLEPWEVILLRECSLDTFVPCLTIVHYYSNDTVYSLRIGSYWILQISSPTTSIHAATSRILPLGTRSR